MGLAFGWRQQWGNQLMAWWAKRDSGDEDNAKLADPLKVMCSLPPLRATHMSGYTHTFLTATS